MSKKAEERYALTVLGLLKPIVGEEKGRQACDALELYMRRNNLGIAIVDNALRFVELVRQEDES